MAVSTPQESGRRYASAQGKHYQQKARIVRNYSEKRRGEGFGICEEKEATLHCVYSAGRPRGPALISLIEEIGAESGERISTDFFATGMHGITRSEGGTLDHRYREKRAAAGI